LASRWQSCLAQVGCGRVTQHRRRTSAALARATPVLQDRIKHGCQVNSFPTKTHHVSGHAYLKHQV